MAKLNELLEWLDVLAPLTLSESWDNTGLLLGDRSGEVSRVQTCLTLSPDCVEEAVVKQAQLVISHHPLPFKPLNKITTDTQAGGLLWRLASHGIAVYAPHTAWDSAPLGINQRLGDILKLDSITPLIPSEDDNLAASGLGAGRAGSLSESSSTSVVAKALANSLPHCRIRIVNPRLVGSRVAIACGSGGSLLAAARKAKCEIFVTGEATYHTCLEARDSGMGLILVGHYASERFAMEALAGEIASNFSDVQCWASEAESDPVCLLDE